MEQFSARTIQAFVDGELPPADTAAVSERLLLDSELATRVEFERALRRGVATAMSRDAAPAEVRRRVVSRLAAERADDADDADDSAASPETSWLAGPRKANVFAVAASLALVAGAILFGIFGRPIDTLRDGAELDLISDLSRFVASEHRRCAVEVDSRAGKTRWIDPDVTRESLEQRLGAPVIVPDLEPLGYRFVGGGPCHVPGGPSGQMLYQHPGMAADGCPDTLLSVFVVASTPPDGARPSDWLSVETPGKIVLTTCDGQVTYLLVACTEGDLRGVARAVAAGLDD